MEKIAKAFEKAISKAFDDFLSGYGFLKTKCTSGNNGFSVIYRNEDRYVHLGGTLHPHDYPYYFYLTFGEGSDAFPESDWNAAALWRIMQEKFPDEYKKHEALYEIPSDITEPRIEQKIQTTKELCESYGTSFLENDLELFRQVRKTQNKGREPYKHYTPDETGKYVVSNDEESERLKKKYSD